jgi:hypothetical protein
LRRVLGQLDIVESFALVEIVEAELLVLRTDNS